MKKPELDVHPDFDFCLTMPRAKKPESPRERLGRMLHELASAGVSARQLAASISDGLSVRTVENWLQGRCFPADWVCSLVCQEIEASKKILLVSVLRV